MSPDARISASSDAQGRFTTQLPALDRSYTIVVRKRGFFVVGPKGWVLTGPAATVWPRIVVDEMSSLSGVVVDEHGAPVSGVKLRAEQHRYGPAAKAESDAEGRFKIYRNGPTEDRVRIFIDSASTCEPAEPTKAFAWGEGEIRIELRRSQQVELRVVEAGTGAVVEECVPVRSTSERMAS
ncbi:MAG: carboxypeptidase-like regulatory domain-containing protein [Myxococcota bacterium]